MRKLGDDERSLISFSSDGVVFPFNDGEADGSVVLPESEPCEKEFTGFRRRVLNAADDHVLRSGLGSGMPGGGSGWPRPIGSGRGGFSGGVASFFSCMLSMLRPHLLAAAVAAVSEWLRALVRSRAVVDRLGETTGSVMEAARNRGTIGASDLTELR